MKGPTEVVFITFPSAVSTQDSHEWENQILLHDVTAWKYWTELGGDAVICKWDNLSFAFPLSPSLCALTGSKDASPYQLIGVDLEASPSATAPRAQVHQSSREIAAELITGPPTRVWWNFSRGFDKSNGGCRASCITFTHVVFVSVASGSSQTSTLIFRLASK